MATTPDTFHIANHGPTRARELAWIRTSALQEFHRVLINEVRVRHNTGEPARPDIVTTGDPELDAFLAGDTGRNPYGTTTGDATMPLQSTLALVIDRDWLIAPPAGSPHRRGLPLASTQELSTQGLQGLATVIMQDINNRNTIRTLRSA